MYKKDTMTKLVLKFHGPERYNDKVGLKSPWTRKLTLTELVPWMRNPSLTKLVPKSMDDKAYLHKVGPKVHGLDV